MKSQNTKQVTRVMLIDDEPFALEVLRGQLRRLGVADIRAHEHAEKAVRETEADDEPVDLIFCDLQMPGMDGVQFIRELGRIGYDGGLVLVSGEDARILQTARRLAEGHRLNVIGTLQKPSTLEQLRGLLHAPAGRRVVARKQGPPITAAELRDAIDTGQLLNHYQPKVDIRSGGLIGVEALVRWQHPEYGRIFPDQFISLAEEHALIEPLTQTVLQTALQDTRRWLSDGLDLHVAINVSMQSLADLGFADRLIDSAKRFDVPLDRLVVEATETMLLDDRVSATEILTRLRLRHVGVSIDDFGTGHSSLTKLHDIPFNELKIDRGFVHGAAHDPELRSIVEASLQLAMRLGIRSVAEGVEDADDWVFLRDSGCNVAQGYFVARPMPAEQLAGWLAIWPEQLRKDAGHA